METEITQHDSFMQMLLLDLLIFILLIVLFYFLYKLYLHLIKYPEKSQL